MAGLVPGWFDAFNAGAGSSFSHQVPGGDNIAIGDLVMVVFSWFDTAANARTVSSISDGSVGTPNTYTQYGAYTRRPYGASEEIVIGVFICNAATAAVTQPTFVVTLSGNQTGGIGLGYLNYTNQNASPRAQIATGVSTAGATSLTGNALTTAEGNDLVIVFGAEDIPGNPRTTPTYTGSTPDANYITRCNASNNSTSQDLLVADRGSSTDPNGRIASGVSTAPRYNYVASQVWVLDNFLLKEASGAAPAADIPRSSRRPDPWQPARNWMSVR